MATPPSSGLESFSEPATERRASTRQSCRLEVCLVTPGAAAEKPPCAAVLRDISAGGIGLLVHEAIPRGSVVTIQLHSETQGIVFRKSLRIKYARSEGAEGWSVGGSFEKPLTKKEMKQLLNGNAGSE